MINRLDGKITIAVIHTRKHVADSEHRPFLTQFGCRRDVNRGGSGALFQTTQGNQPHGVKKTGIFFDEGGRQ